MRKARLENQDKGVANDSQEEEGTTHVRQIRKP